jgi:hypothetical protein
MRTTMDKEKLLAVLRANREKHVSDFKDAWAGFLVTVTEETTAFLLRVQDVPTKIDRWGLGWVKPESHEADYDRAIGMVSDNVNPTIELGDEEYSNYVLDEWQWKKQFAVTTEMYSGKFAR